MAGTRESGTTRRGVPALADWLRSWQVPAVVIEATGDYWKGPYYRLEAEGFELRRRPDPIPDDKDDTQAG